MDLLTEIPPTPQIAEKKVRFLAALTDFIILIFGCYLIASFSGQTYSENGRSGFNLTGISFLMAIALMLLLFPIIEGFTGQTIGKRVFNIKVVKTNFTKTDLGTSITRHLFDCIDCIFLIGFIIASTNPHNQRIGDLVAKTYVVMKQ